MSKQMTDWFPAHIKPVRVGVYEVKTKDWNSLTPTYALWDGYCWGYFIGSVKSAILSHPGKAEAVQNKQWRGFTEKQQ